jgi:hypothetical protein
LPELAKLAGYNLTEKGVSVINVNNLAFIRYANIFKRKPMKATDKKRAKQAAKMVYVGFSRPTHLLCFAVHESRFSKLESDIDKNIWEVVRL